MTVECSCFYECASEYTLDDRMSHFFGFFQKRIRRITRVDPTQQTKKQLFGGGAVNNNSSISNLIQKFQQITIFFQSNNNFNNKKKLLFKSDKTQTKNLHSSLCPRGLLYLSKRPTNARIWHKAVFKVGPVAGPKPTRVRQGQKYLRPRRHSPFGGASGAKPEEISSAEAHPAEPPRGKTAYQMQPKNWRGKVTNILEKNGDLCIYRCVPPTHEYGTRPFLRWARSQSRSPHASGKAKNIFGPVGIPLFGAPQAPGNKPNHPEGGISLGGWPPEAGGTLQCRGTPGRTVQR